MKLYAAIALLSLTATATADVLLTRKIHTDEVATPNGTRPAKDDTQTIWVGKDRVRLDAGPMAYIVRIDKRKLYLLNASDQTFSALDLPVNLASYVPPEDLDKFEQGKARLNISATVFPTGEVERLNGWATSKFKVQVTSLGTSSDEIFWTTKDIEIDWATYWEAQRAVRSLQLNPESMLEQLRKIDGVTVKAERTRTTPMGKEHSVEELVSAERKEAPEGLYDVPADYKEKPFNGLSALRSMMGARPNAGPGDAAPSKPAEEKPADSPKRRGAGEKEKKDGEEKKRDG